MEKRFGVLETRFNARESREEDVERIKQLEALCAHQEKEVVFIREQMEKIKVTPLLILGAVHTGHESAALEDKRATSIFVQRLLTIQRHCGQAELLLREDNYNNTFANGGAGKAKLNVGKAQNAQNATMDWMLGKKKSNNGRNNGAVLNNENSTRVTGRTGSGR